MLQQQVYLITTILMTADALCVIVAGYGAYFIVRAHSGGDWGMPTDIFVGSVVAVMFVFNYVMGRVGLYSDKRPPRYLGLYFRIFKSLLASFAVLSIGIFIWQLLDYSRLFTVTFAILSFVLIAGYRTIYQFYLDKISRTGFNRRKILLVSNRQKGEFVASLLTSQLSWGHEIAGRLSIDPFEASGTDALGCIGDLPKVLRDYTIDEVAFAIEGCRGIDLRPYLDVCQKTGVPARILPSLWSRNGARLALEMCQQVPFITIGSSNFNATGLLYKRLLDIIGGFAGTLLFFIMYPFIAVAIKLDSPGPVVFKQVRVGQNGRKFNLYKFRSMYSDAEQKLAELKAKNEMNGAMFKMKNDPRITRVGRWLRKTSLDEFPQFLNVFKGEMSLVGTRPPTYEEVAHYREEHLKRISLKPGITGMWQISGRNKITDFEQVVALDCGYLENWRFFNDLKILFKTVVVVLQRKGAI